MSDQNEGLITDFAAQRATYERFTDSMTAIISSLLALQNITPVTIESRTKTLESFRGKINRPEKQNKYKSLTDITDLAGIRIIGHLHEERNKIFEIIERNFEVDTQNSIDKNQYDEVDRFGYQSLHLIVSLDDRRLALEEFSAFRGLKAEVQIRTALQHAWAAIDWGLRYKSHVGLPPEIRRALFRISALLETADAEFSRLYKEAEYLRHTYREKAEADDLQIPINVESLRAFFTKERSGINLIRQVVLNKEGSVYPFPSDLSSFDFSRLVDNAEKLGLKTLLDLERILETKSTNFENFIARFKSLTEAPNSKFSFNFSPESLVFLRLLFEFSPEIALSGPVNRIGNQELREFTIKFLEELAF